jgi:hypothetical protein
MCGDKIMGGSSRHGFFNRQDEERTYPLDDTQKVVVAEATRELMVEHFPNEKLDARLNHVPVVSRNAMVVEANAAPMAAEIDAVCRELAFFLKIKNARYGNSALEPVQVFSHATPDEQMNNRMDDKLKRIKNSDEHRMNDFVDLAGYIVLKCLNNGWTNFEELLD